MSEPIHDKDCQWEKTTKFECEFRETHFYCPHPEHACTCEFVALRDIGTKAQALLEAVRRTPVGSDIILQNEDMSIFCILTVKCKEHPEATDEDGGRVIKL